MSETVQKMSEDFKAGAKDYSSRMVDWMTTWGIGIVDEKKLWPLLEKAFPFKVIANERYYGKYVKLGKWVDTNCTGMWTHSNTIYIFELEEDAVAFKLRWL